MAMDKFAFYDELTERLDIVDVVSRYVRLEKRGDGYWGCCPFHSEKTPSFHVLETQQKYHCFGCNKGGSVIRFVSEVENISYFDAAQKLAEQIGMEVPTGDGDQSAQLRRKRILSLNKEAARFFREMLNQPEEGAAAREYISQKRRINSRFSARFGLGAAPEGWTTLMNAMAQKGYEKRDLLDAGLIATSAGGRVYDKFRNRLMLPVIDVRGDVIGFTSRILDDNPNAPKYMNTPETSVFRKRQVLYGLNYAKTSKRPNLILVEGNIDVITMHQAGFDNTIATMGTALTPEHIRILERYTKELVVCLDNDAAGEDATQRAIGLLKQSSLGVRVLRLPKARKENGELGKQDPDDYIKNNGAAAFENLLQGSSNSVEYRLSVVEAKYQLDRDDERRAYLQEASALIAGLESPVEREIYAGRCAEKAKVSRESVLGEVDVLRRRKLRKAQRDEERREMNVGQRLQPENRNLRFQNTRSAQAEIHVLRVLLQDESLFDRIPDLTPEQFSAPLLGRAFGILKQRWESGHRVYLPALEAELSREEMDAITECLGEEMHISNAEQVLLDCKTRILEEHSKQTSGTVDEAALLAATERFRKRAQGGGSGG